MGRRGGGLGRRLGLGRFLRFEKRENGLDVVSWMCSQLV